MLRQAELIDRVRVLCADDDRLDAALTYGSFPQGRGDEHSDIEFWLFFTPSTWPRVDPIAWYERVARPRHSVVNEFGTHVVFFPGLIRAEFHFALSTDIPSVGSWPARGAEVDAMVLIDRSGRLRPVLDSVPLTASAADVPGAAEEICGRFANWILLAHHVAARGEELRAFDALAHVQRHLLWMARLRGGETADWLTPSRAAETTVDPARIAAVTEVATAGSAREGVTAGWRAGRAWWRELAEAGGFDVPAGLIAELDAALG
ncbi:hypothetical protein AB0I28_02865 [Phytomonospora sp. NPDC050363]|uniref:hypothetical protein n=1 Tax=Phytomonospora sp. NPDC050363 TaxID=3155642 RepID=UPI0033E26576